METAILGKALGFRDQGFKNPLLLKVLRLGSLLLSLLGGAGY